MQKTSSVHVKDPVVHVRIGWVMETPNNPACQTVRAGHCTEGDQEGVNSPSVTLDRRPRGS